MGEYGKQLDAYLDAFEKKMKVKLAVPEKLARRKQVNDSIELKLDNTPFVPNIRQHSVSASNLQMHHQQSNIELDRAESISSHCEPLSEIDQFDLDRIDDRLRALGVNPDDINSDDNDENPDLSLAGSDLSARIQSAVGL